MADAVPANMDESKIMKIVFRENLTGLANNVKWNKLITYMRNLEGWKPSWRSKSVNGYMSEWDVEWWYHLPFPFKLVRWFDIGCHEINRTGALTDDKVIDHSEEFISMLKGIGFEYEKRNGIIRIFGYSPKDYEAFDEN
ncbi:MAG: hypothetical protein SynsKO_29400 [Synoicihabitans sp.]